VLAGLLSIHERVRSESLGLLARALLLLATRFLGLLVLHLFTLVVVLLG
jgi:hypothetical protein